MMDYAPARAQYKGAISTPNCGWGQAEATVATIPSTSPPPTTDRVNKLYHPLAEIQAIATAQLAECTRWHRSDPTPSPVRAGTRWQGHDKMPSMSRIARHRLTSSPKPHCSGKAHMSSPQCIGGPIMWARNLSSMHGTHTTMSLAAGGNTAMTLRGGRLRCLEAVRVTHH
jgi:hypothetical protein